MAARRKSRQIAGLKIKLSSVPLLPETREELQLYGDELARYANEWSSLDQAVANGKGRHLVDHTDGDAQMLRRWLGTLPSPPRGVLKDITAVTQSITLGKARVVAPIKGQSIDLAAHFELDIPDPKAALGFMLASILATGYGENLRQCGNDRCGIWYFDIPSGRSMKLYCSPKCSNSARQRRHAAKAKGIRK